MSEEATSTSNHVPPLSKGTYAPAKPTDKRSPCPMINCLANHGYIPRDGRNIHAHELYAAVKQAGVASDLAATLSYTIYSANPSSHTPGVEVQQQQQEHRAGEAEPSRASRWWSRLLISLNPLTRFGLREPGQTDSMGRRVLDLDQFAAPGVLEHDVSLSRRDRLQPQGSIARQADLVEGLLESSADGKNITRADMAALKRRRIAVQQRENPGLVYGKKQHFLACGEMALIFSVFGNGSSAPLEYVRPFFEEERLPVQEGWTRRWWWTIGFVELQIDILKMWWMIGFKPQ